MAKLHEALVDLLALGRRIFPISDADIAAALDIQGGPYGGLLDNVVQLSIDKINLERELSTIKTRAAKNAAIALLAFGLIAVEIIGVALYFLPK